jgi:hexosaminidase
MGREYGKKLQLIVTLFATLFLGGCVDDNSNISIIPNPQELKTNSGQFIIDENTKIIVDPDNLKLREVAEYFAEQFNTASGFSIKIVASSNNIEIKNSIIFTNKELDSSLGEEGYSIVCNTEKILLNGSPHGLFYGVQTLFQLLPNEVFNNKNKPNLEWKIPSVEIFDAPRFKWRGMHLDVGRHMFPVSFIKKYIDYIAMHKLNTFHWHLTEDQGWRIEIKKYPRLTEKGAWRNGTQILKTDSSDGIRYGGYYSQNEIKEVVKYAEERFITVVPEIEMPGHSVAALTSYPSLSCTGGPFEVRTLWGIDENIFCAGNEETFAFLENVLTEVLELFPSKYIHIGGDEAPKTRWKECTKCQLRIQKEGLKDEHELQSYFITRIEKFLNSKGRQIIGWDEILEGGLAPNAAVMSWRGIEGGISAAKRNHNVVMSPTDYCYFDYYEGQPENEPLAIGGYLPLEKVYSYEPIPEELNSNEQKYIMGVQANQWTEYIATPELVEYMTFPRLCALAEVAWSVKEKRNYEDFSNRMVLHYGRLYELGINYRWPGFEELSINTVFINDAMFQIKSKQENMEIYFTTDGSEPTQNSILYTGPIKITESTSFKIREFTEDNRSGPIYKSHYRKENPYKPVIVNTEKMGLSFEYYEFTDQIKSVTKLKKMEFLKKGEVSNFIYPFEENKFPEKFGLVYEGYIEISEEDVYMFSVNSNDGSQLYVADKLVVDNDGLHGAYEKEGEIALKIGKHKIELLYFQAGGRKVLNVSIKNKTSEKKEISYNILSF